jgi:hypothetical protein
MSQGSVTHTKAKLQPMPVIPGQSSSLTFTIGADSFPLKAGIIKGLAEIYFPY